MSVLSITTPEIGSVQWGTTVNLALDTIVTQGNAGFAPLASPTFTGLVTTAGQIKFPVLQNASADVNTLDDYEEAVFSPAPVVSYTIGNVGLVYTSSGKYTKIGNKVTIYVTIAITDIGSATGEVKIANMPFLTTGYYGCGMLFFDVAKTAGNFFQTYLTDTDIYLNQTNDAGSATRLTHTSVKTGSTLFISCTYLNV